MRARRSSRAILTALALLLAACTPIPRPAALADIDRVRVGASAVEAARYAPDAFARAEKLRTEAEVAFGGSDHAGAQILAERALGADAHAAALARIARAEVTAREAEGALKAAEAELTALDADQQRVGSEAEALEQKVKVARDAQPIQPSGRADPERERARLAAARSLTMEARLLCGAARLLITSSAPPDDKAKAALDEADATLSKVLVELSAASVPAAPIDGATRARAACLAALTLTRRAASPTSRATGAGDALLAAISATRSYAPARDDRGVVVALRGVFAGNGSALSPQGEARLAELGRIAAAHPTFPIEIIVHTDKPLPKRDEDAARTRAEAAARALEKAAGATRVRTLALVAGADLPVADPRGPERARNARIEIVFITPETL